MPETKTIILLVAVILLILLVTALSIDKLLTLSEQHEQELADMEVRRELEINQSWDDGWDIGYEWGAYNIFVEVIERGFYAHNETWVLYSPQGCLMAIQNEGCEVRCP